MLEQQQSQLVAGVQELYRKLQTGEAWPGAALDAVHDGHPLTHDILKRLDLVHTRPDSSIKQEGFEEDLTYMQQHLINSGESSIRRRDSASSICDPGIAYSEASHNTPPMLAMSSVQSQVSIPEQQFTPLSVAPTSTPREQQWMVSPTSVDVTMEVDIIPSYDPSMNFEYNQFSASSMPLGDVSGDDFDSFIDFQAQIRARVAS